MLTIYKYPISIVDQPITEPFELTMPLPEKILSLQLQSGVPTLWVLVDPEAPQQLRTLQFHATGAPIERECNRKLEYIATLQFGPYSVYHLFDVSIHDCCIL